MSYETNTDISKRVILSDLKNGPIRSANGYHGFGKAIYELEQCGAIVVNRSPFDYVLFNSIFEGKNYDKYYDMLCK